MRSNDAPRQKPGTAPRLEPPRLFRRRRLRVVVADESMLPTLVPGDRLYVDARAFRNGSARTGDLVVLKDPDDPSKWLVKRVRALGPSTLWRTRSGFRDPMDSERSPEGIPPADVIEEIELPRGSLYVISDSPGTARDSRKFGPVEARDLIGRVIRRYYPLHRRHDF
jgi:signal peptidase I